MNLSNEREDKKMLGALLGIEELVLFVPVGLIFVMIFILHFTLMLIYSIIADTYGLPQPLDSDYLFGRINNKIFMGSMIVSVICLII